MTRPARALWAILEQDPDPTTYSSAARDAALMAILCAGQRGASRELGVTPEELERLYAAVLDCEVTETIS